jgi:hypothetical protein
MSASPTDAKDTPPGGITKIIGIGQTLRGDDAAGIAAVSLWQKTFPASAGQPHIIVELIELPGIGLLNLLERSTPSLKISSRHLSLAQCPLTGGEYLRRSLLRESSLLRKCLKN